MKRFVSLIALPILLAAGLSSSALAGHWVTNEVKWNKTSVGAPWSGTAVYTRDTTYNVVAAGQTDTTGAFTLDYAQTQRAPYFAASDTTVLAYLLLASDSAGVAASTVNSATIEVDGKVGGLGMPSALAGWCQLDSLVVKWVNNPATNNAFVPIRAVSGLGYPDGENRVNYAYAIKAFGTLRVRLTPGAGVLSACRAFVRYWTDSE